MNASSVNPTGINFVNEINGNTRYRLTGGDVISFDGPVIIMVITIADKNAIKARENLAISNDTTYIAIRATTVSDNAGNHVLQIPARTPLQVSQFTPDAERPSLMSFDLDMNEGILLLHFNETVNVSTLFVDRFTLQDNMTRILINHTLTTSTVQEENAATVQITISIFDLNEIKRKQFCYTPDNCYLVFEDNAVQDMVDIPIDGVPDGQAFMVDVFVNDTTRPQIAEFTRIDLANGTVTISFTETVNASSFNFAAVTLMDLFVPHLASVTLTGGVTNDSDSDVIQFTLEMSDLLRIQASNNLCTHRGNCYIRFTSDFVSDMVGNPIIPVIDQHPGFIVRFFGADIVKPELISFALNINDSLLLLTFNEPVKASSLDATGITIQGEANTTNPVFYHRLTGGTTTSQDDSVIVVQLQTSDLNALKASVFAKDSNSTYIAIEARTITDNAFTPNEVMPITTDAALQLIEGAFTPDSTPPFLQRYTLDMDSDLLILTFNEPIDHSSVDCVRITLYNTNSTSEVSLTLSGCILAVNEEVAGLMVVTLELINPDITELKVNRNFATSADNVFISFPAPAFADTAGNLITPVDFRRVTTFIADQTRPMLLSFTYDQLLGQINLTFSDVVASATLDPTAITLQHDLYRADGRTFSPSISSNTSSQNGYLIVLDLSHFDLLRLKSNTGVGRSENDTYITIAASLIDDTAGVDTVPITDGKAILVAQFVPDNVPPVLLNYRLDMNLGAIFLTFSDTVNLTTFNQSGIVIQESLNATASGSANTLRLADGVASRSVDGLSVTLNISVDDLNELKRNLNIATGPDNTFLVIETGTILDLAGNNLVGIPDSSALQPAQFINDTTPPELLSFDLDMNTGNITLTFNETVNSESIEVVEFTLQNAAETPTQSYTFSSDASSSLQNSTVVEIYLTKQDIDAINRLRELATKASDVFLSLTEFAIADMNSNQVVAIPNNSALQVTNFTDDTTPPVLLSYDLNIDSATFTFSFSEVVDYDSFDPTQLTLLSAQNNSLPEIETYTLLGGRVRPIDDTVLYLDIDTDDLNEIKRLANLAISENTTFIAFASTLVADTFNNSVMSVAPTAPLQVSQFISDFTPPLAVSFTLDVNQGLLNLTFDETVNASSFRIEAVTIQSSAVSPVQMHSLWYSTSSQEDSTQIVVYLHQQDLDAIKLLNLLATHEDNTYLRLADGLVDDMNANRFRETTINGSHIPDTTPPELESYIFDLNEGVLVLNFSEAVNTSTLDATGLVLFSSTDTNNTNSSYRLTQESITYDGSAKSFNVTISADDLNAIKADFNLATELDNTFLIIDPYTIFDMAGNAVSPTIIPAMAAEFIPDVTSPQLVRATFNFNGGLLSFTFDETVNVDMFIPTEITLQNDHSMPPYSLRLTSGEFTMENSTLIVVVLSDYDLNRLKNLPNFFTSPMQSYISISNITVTDMSGNNVVPISLDAALMLCNVTNDIVSPDILGFDLDLDAELLTIRFSETIDPATLDVTQLWIQNAEFNSSVEVQLTGFSQPPSWNLTVVVIQLTFSDLNEIKLRETLATDINTTYLRFINTTASDTSGNSLSTLNDTQGIPVTLFTPDTTPPMLDSFTLDMDSPELLHLTFSEPVRANSVDFTTITLQSVDNITLDVSEFYTLTNGTIQSGNGLTITIRLDFFDVVSIQSRRQLAINRQSTFISLNSATFEDMNFNPSVNISSEAALPASGYTRDDTVPELQAFSVNLNSGVLTLTFTEAMDSASVGNGQYSLQSIPTVGISPPPNSVIRFLGGLNASVDDWYIIDITLSFEQLNIIKLFAPDGFYVDNTTSYIATVAANLPTDTAGNPLVIISDSSIALSVSEYIPDVTQPVLLDFRFNAEGINAMVSLDFSEPVLLSSLDFTQIEFQNSAHNSTSTTTLRLSGGTPTTTMNGLTLDFILDSDDFNILKSLTDIANNVNDTFIFFNSGAITDMYGNDISEEDGRTVQASLVLSDITHPELDTFTLDINSGVLSLTFSETVNVSTLQTAEITLQSSANAPEFSYTLTGGISSTLNQPIVTVSLTSEDLNEIKMIRGLATRRNNTYISITADAVSDMVGFNLTAVTVDSALRANRLTADTTSPVLLNFSLNLTSEELVIVFDETISYVDTVLVRFTLQSDPNGTFVTLSDASTISMNDSTEITIFLDTSDLNRVKLDTSLATSSSNTQLLMVRGAVRDMAGNPNMEQTLDTGVFFPDFVSPSLENFLFDLDSGLILFNFDETINASSLDISALTFTDMPNGAVIFTLNGVFANSSNGPRLELYITEEDLNAIKQNTSLLTSMSNAFLALGANFIADMNGNQLRAVAGVQAAMFQNDTTSPALVGFDLDMDLGHLRLVFSETVDASSFDPTGVTLQSTGTSMSDATQYTLTGGYLLSTVDDTEVTLVIDVDDLNEIKARGIARDNFTTWLALNASTVRDMSNLPVLPLVNRLNVTNVDLYNRDMTGPVLLNFTLNLTSEAILLTFNETVDVFSINVTQFTLQNTSSETTLSEYTLTEASTPILIHGPVITINLGDQDLNEIKRHVYLGTSTQNTFLSFTELAVADRAGNQVTPRSPNNSLQAHIVFEDLRRPMLEEFEFDLNRGLVILTFSETVQAESIVVGDFTLQSSRELVTANGSVYYNLTGGDVLSTDSPIIVIMLSNFDLNEIKLIPTLASGADNISENTFITLRSTGVRDSNGRFVFEISEANALEATDFTSDVTPPALRGFNLDLDNGTITLNFTEAVNGSTLDPTGLTLRSENSTNATAVYTLTNGTVIRIEQTILEVQITEYDLNSIKALLDLATTLVNTYLTIEEASVLDTSGNPVLGTTPEDATAISNLRVDDTRPDLLGFDLDLDSGNLTLTFSETVLATSINPTAFTIQRLQSLTLIAENASLFYTLTEGNVTTLENTVLVLQITNSDLNQLKRRSRLATDQTTTFLSITEDAVTDASGNKVTPTTSLNATRVTNYTEDTTPPDLLSFYLDLNMGQLTLRFSETVNASTLNLPLFTFQDACPSPTDLIPGTNSTNGTSSSNTTNITSYTLTGN